MVGGSCFDFHLVLPVVLLSVVHWMIGGGAAGGANERHVRFKLLFFHGLLAMSHYL